MRKIFEAIGKTTMHIGVICAAVIFMKLVPFWLECIVAVVAVIGLAAIYYDDKEK
jgi:hypothetical protein